MKKTLAHRPTSRRTRALRVRLVGALALVGLVAGLGLLASRPAHTVGGPVAVAVSNVPLPTTPADEAVSRVPFMENINCVIQNGSTESFPPDNTTITVPAGKRLIIQTVGLYRLVSQGGSLQAYIVPIVNANPQSFALPVVTANGIPQLGVTQSMTLSSDPGKILRMDVFRSSSAGTEVDVVTVYGYLINA